MFDPWSQEDSLEKEMATDFSILAWEATVKRVRHDWVTKQQQH